LERKQKSGWHPGPGSAAAIIIKAAAKQGHVSEKIKPLRPIYKPCVLEANKHD
jgi:hypothetical protein